MPSDLEGVPSSREPLLVEYQVCNDRIESLGNRCWLAGSLFIGAAFASLAVTLAAEKSLDPLVPVVGAVLTTSTLIGLKLFLVNEEWRSTVCYDRMRRIERAYGMEITTLIGSLTRGRRLGWTRFPFRLPQNDSQSADGRVDGQSRVAFGWEFLHAASWLAIISWFGYSLLYWVEYYGFLRPADWAMWVQAMILVVPFGVLWTVWGWSQLRREARPAGRDEVAPRTDGELS